MPDYPAVGQHAYPGGPPQPAGAAPPSKNQPDLAPPPCPSYSSQPNQGYTSNVGVSQEQVHLQPLLGASPQPSAPPENQYPVEHWEAGQGSNYVELFSDIPDGVDDDTPEREDYGPQHPTESFEPIPGYECVAYDMITDVPPPPYEAPSEAYRPSETFLVPDALSEKVARDAILTFVDQNCCYGSRPAKQMAINSVVPSSALHYQLETYTEARNTRRAHRPYRGGHVDGPGCGRAPLPWEIECQPVAMFETYQTEVEVPHTSVIRACFKCDGCGTLTCGKCHGAGKKTCSSCYGKGYKRVKNSSGNGYQKRNCFRCSGSGKVTCSRCHGSGRVTCNECEGFKSLRHFIELVVNFTNHPSDYILEGTDMPDELIRDVSGQVLFEQTLPFVWPISQYSIQQINENSIRLVGEHCQAWPMERTLMQRQNLRSVPVSEVAYTWKNVNTRFWVYGYEHEVYAPDYPHQCCWGCNIL